MISKFLLIALINVAYIKANPTSYSKVYLRGDLPAYTYENSLLPLQTDQNSPPSLPSGSNFSPCSLVISFLIPCVWPNQVYPPTNPNQNLINYNPPNQRTPETAQDNFDTPRGYQYGYVIYDDSTGDQKQQKELSDGQSVHGQYSFVQPDGYIRQVQYTADDLNGFNAVVKNIPTNSGYYYPSVINESAEQSQETKNQPDDKLKQTEKSQPGDIIIVTEVPDKETKETVDIVKDKKAEDKKSEKKTEQNTKPEKPTVTEAMPPNVKIDTKTEGSVLLPVATPLSYADLIKCLQDYAKLSPLQNTYRPSQNVYGLPQSSYGLPQKTYGPPKSSLPYVLVPSLINTRPNL